MPEEIAYDDTVCHQGDTPATPARSSPRSARQVFRLSTEPGIRPTRSRAAAVAAATCSAVGTSVSVSIWARAAVNACWAATLRPSA